MTGLAHPSERTAARWPVWYAPLGFVVALGAVTVVLTLLTLVEAVASGDLGGRSALSTIVGTLAQDVGLVAVAVGLAALMGRPAAADFGLRPASLKRSLLWLAGAAVFFYAATSAYELLIKPQGEQDVLRTLGADEGPGYLVATGLIVLVLAPVCEEVFFRGFFYRSLRNRLSTPAAVAVVACVFGAIHYTGPDTLPLLPVLALLGAIFCLLYELTGSLYPAIALHAINNSIALAATAASAAAPIVAAVGGTIVLTGCAVAARMQLAPTRG